jgi:hypothetical protein
MEQTKDFEEEQIQQILLNESEKQKLQMDRELKETQDKEYKRSLEIDLSNTLKQSTNEYDRFEYISTEEMRRVRLLRFDGYKLIKE